MIDVVEISKERYTTKHYDKTKQVTEDQLNQLLEVIRNAPSSVNVQPWHFIVVNNQTSSSKILPAVFDFNHARIVDSSYTIIFCIKEELSDAYLKHVLDKEREDGRFGNANAEIEQAQDTGRRYFVSSNSQTEAQLFDWESRQLYIALGQFLFAAKAIGIDSTPIEGFDPKVMDSLLNLPEQGFKSVVLASIGFGAKNDSNAARPKSRLSKEELFTFI